MNNNIDSNVVEKKGTSEEIKCPSCGHSLKFNATESKFKCDYCGKTFDASEVSRNDNSTTDTSTSGNQAETTTTTDGKVYYKYTCPSCGAEIICDEETTSTFCVYCGNTEILKDKLTGTFKPDKIIPFSKDLNTVKEQFKALKKGRIFAPDNFFSDNNINKIKGIYIPFWLFSYHINGTVDIEGVESSYYSVGNSDYREDNYYLVTKQIDANFINIPEDGALKFDDNLMNSIEPFDYSKLIDFDSAYLSGFYAENYDDSKGKKAVNAVNRMENSCVDYAKNDINNCNFATFGLPVGLRLRFSSVVGKNFSPNLTSSYYVLLPVYMVNIKYDNKVYTFAMNGETGKFIGDIPVDKKKAIKTFILIGLSIFLVVAIIWLLVYIFGVNVD